MTRSRNNRASRARRQPERNDSHSVEFENGLRCVSRTQKWTTEELAYLYEARKQGKAYKEIQKKLLRTCLAMRLKVHHMYQANNKNKAKGKNAVENMDAVAGSGREDTVSETAETVTAEPPATVEPPARAAQPTSGKGCESMDLLAFAAEQAERAEQDVNTSTARRTDLKRMTVSSLLN